MMAVQRRIIKDRKMKTVSKRSSVAHRFDRPTGSRQVKLTSGIRVSPRLEPHCVRFRDWQLAVSRCYIAVHTTYALRDNCVTCDRCLLAQCVVWEIKDSFYLERKATPPPSPPPPPPSPTQLLLNPGIDRIMAVWKLRHLPAILLTTVNNQWFPTFQLKINRIIHVCMVRLQPVSPL